MAKFKNMKTVITIVEPAQVQFRRTTSRYKRKGTFSSNKGFLSVGGRDTYGRFVSQLDKA